MITFEKLMKLGLDRELPELLQPKEGISIGLGESGRRKSAEIALGYPDWYFPRDPIPAEDNTVAIIHAYHFLEHITGEDAMKLLMEVQRVLMPGGIFQFSIPHSAAEIATIDLTHKSFWNEKSFRNLFGNGYYDATGGSFTWKLKVHYLVIAGVVDRNRCVMGQLVKEE